MGYSKVTENKKILILEDDPFVQILWEKAIGSCLPDFSIECVQSVSALVDKYGSVESLNDKFMFFIVDIFLCGDQTGIEFIQKLSVAHNRIIIESSADFELLYDICRQNKIYCHMMTKPFHIAKAASLLKDMCKEYAKDLDEKDLINTKNTKNDFSIYKPIILVTGCSSGVGLELAHMLTGNQYYRVVLTARSKSLNILQSKFKDSERLMILPLDVTNLEDINRIINIVHQRWGSVDVLVNNAGVCYRSVVEHMDSDTELIQMKTNYLGPVALMRAVIPTMREKGRGKIINVSSASGVMGMPTMGSYSASKHAIEGASESLWYELQPFGINITVVRPGLINSNGYTHVVISNKAKLSSQIVGPFSDYYKYMSNFINNVMGKSLQDSKDVAKVVLRIVQTQNPPLWINATFDAKLLLAFKKLMPESLHYKLVNFILKFSFKWGGYSKAVPNRLRARTLKFKSQKEKKHNKDEIKDAA